VQFEIEDTGIGVNAA
jgi:signal transduction histidine kinase